MTALTAMLALAWREFLSEWGRIRAPLRFQSRRPLAHGARAHEGRL